MRELMIAALVGYGSAFTLSLVQALVHGITDLVVLLPILLIVGTPYAVVAALVVGVPLFALLGERILEHPIIVAGIGLSGGLVTGLVLATPAFPPSITGAAGLVTAVVWTQRLKTRLELAAPPLAPDAAL